eukprot:TRINITY_DN2744_c0_g1_i1.p2 TRINITY_DN2744_c0_g1~~TRINITY_DN2744_c0_g1_i1.p2  ORF type:complete len:304 (-),score=116.66 TRINITY_DN2744_c0_g1_i1:243-1154(-)
MGCTGSKTASAAAAAPIVAAPEGDYKLTVERTDAAQSVGLTIVANSEPAGILVQGLKEEGLVPTYNKQYENTPEQQVREGDVIVAVNAVFGDFEQMKKELEQQKISMIMKRPATTTPDLTEQPKQEGEAAGEPVASAAVTAEAAPAVEAQAETAPADAAAVAETSAAAPVAEAASAETAPAAEAVEAPVAPADKKDAAAPVAEAASPETAPEAEAVEAPVAPAEKGDAAEKNEAAVEAPAPTEKEDAAAPEAAAEASQEAAAVDPTPAPAVVANFVEPVTEGAEGVPEDVQKTVCCWGYNMVA